VRGFIDGEYQDGEIRGCGFIAGVRGMGKTTEMGRLLSLCTGGVLFFDPLARHEHVLPGRRLIHHWVELENYLRVNRGRRFRIIYQPRGGSIDEHFKGVAACVRAFGWMIFAIDELDMLCGARFGDARMPQELYDLVNYGRHARVSMLATARYPMSVARGFTSQCATLRLFYMREKKHLQYFEEYIGEEISRLPSLPKYHYLFWDGSENSQIFMAGRAL